MTFQNKKRNIAGIALVLFIFVAACGALCEGSEQYSSQPANAIPDDLCGAVMTYFAEIDAVKETDDVTRRMEGYARARAKLEPWLNKYKNLDVTAEILEYAKYSELMKTQDPKDPKFLDLVEKTLKTRASFIQRCNSFTLNR